MLLKSCPSNNLLENSLFFKSFSRTFLAIPLLEKLGLSPSLNGENLSFSFTLFLAALGELNFL
jgi:hypothetical protein